MKKQINIDEFYEIRKKSICIDVRSPKEFNSGHICGAFNIPILEDNERHEVGKIYKNSSKAEAIDLGLEIVGKKLANFVKICRNLSLAQKKEQFIIYCWRGGMRSSSFLWLLETAGIKATKIDGGYKSYRRYNRELFDHDWNIKILSGHTGSGKTEVLHYLNSIEEQIVDLEGIAHHKGSSFGSFGENPQPTNEQFENDLAEEWVKLDLKKRIWIEDESHAIGKVRIPDEIYLKMRKADVYQLRVPNQNRIERLLSMYTSFPSDLIIEAITRLKKRLGGKRCSECIQYIENKDYSKAIIEVLSYYDRTYDYGLSKRNKETIFPLEVSSFDLKMIAKNLLKLVENKKEI